MIIHVIATVLIMVVSIHVAPKLTSESVPNFVDTLIVMIRLPITCGVAIPLKICSISGNVWWRETP